MDHRHNDRGSNVSVGHRLVAAVTPLVVTALTLTGCAGGSQSESATTPAAPTTTSTTQVRTECTAVSGAARNLANQVAALVDGRASRDQVTVAAQQLRAALEAAGAVIKPESRADADAARAALGELQTVLDTQPINLAAARAATRQALEAVGRLLAVCAPGTTSAPGTLPPVPTTS